MPLLGEPTTEDQPEAGDHLSFRVGAGAGVCLQPERTAFADGYDWSQAAAVVGCGQLDLAIEAGRWAAGLHATAAPWSLSEPLMVGIAVERALAWPPPGPLDAAVTLRYGVLASTYQAGSWATWVVPVDEPPTAEIIENYAEVGGEVRWRIAPGVRANAGLHLGLVVTAPQPYVTASDAGETASRWAFSPSGRGSVGLQCLIPVR